MKVAWWLCPDQSREQRGDKCENTQPANLSDSKDKSAITAQENTDTPATFGQIRIHHQTDRDICHFTKFPTTLGYFGKFYSMTKRLVRMSKYVSIYFFSNMTHQCCLMQMSDWSLIWESILTSSTFENSDTLDVWTTHAMHVWYKLTNTVGNIFVYICIPRCLQLPQVPQTCV